MLRSGDGSWPVRGVAEVREKFNLTLQDFPAFFLFVDSWHLFGRTQGHRGRSFALHESEEGANDATRYVDAVQAANMIKWLCLDMLCQPHASDCQTPPVMDLLCQAQAGHCENQSVMDSCACAYYLNPKLNCYLYEYRGCAVQPLGHLLHCPVARMGYLCRRSIQSMSWTISSTNSSKMPVRGNDYAY